MKEILLLITLILTITGCSDLFNQKPTPVKEIFSFPIGYDKEEMGILPSKSGNTSMINYYYSNGFYYVSDPVNNKILKITETGVVVLTIFNEKNYPNLQSNISDENSENNNIALKLYSSYPIYSPRFVSSDNNKGIYVVNRDPEYKKLGSENVINDEMIVKFDGNGTFGYLIGRNGIANSKSEIAPFQYIYKMGCDINNNLIVLEGYNDNLNVYKFSEEGLLINKSVISLSALPLSKSEKDYNILLIDVVIGYMENEIYVVYQFVDEKKELSIDVHTIEYEKVFKFSIASNKFDDMLLRTSPEYLDLTKKSLQPVIREFYGDIKQVQKPMQILIGVDSNSNLYYYQEKLPTKSLLTKEYKMICYNKNGRLDSLKNIAYDYDIEYNSKLFLTKNSKVVSYIIKENKVTFVSVN